MGGIDASLERRIGRDWAKSLALAAICIALVAVSAWGIGIEIDSHHDRRFRNGSYLMLPVFALLTPFVLYRLVVPVGAVLLIAPSGFADRRAADVLIPWSEIRNVVGGGSYVTLTLGRAYARRFPFSPTQRLLKSRRKSAGPGHLLVADWCLKASRGEIYELIQAYRTQYSNAPARA